jgi:hypothetical protein
MHCTRNQQAPHTDRQNTAQRNRPQTADEQDEARRHAETTARGESSVSEELALVAAYMGIECRPDGAAWQLLESICSNRYRFAGQQAMVQAFVCAMEQDWL